VAPRQLDLFSKTTIGTVVRDTKLAMNQAVKESGLSRDQVLDMMNVLAARHGMRLNGKAGLSKEMFEKWLAPDDDSRIPSLKGLTVLCAVLQTTAPLSAMVLLLGGQVIEGDDITMLEIAKLDRQAELIRRRKKKLRDEL